MNSDGIENLMRPFKCFLGCFAQDKLPKFRLKPGKHYSLIANTDKSQYGGTHWVAMWITNNNIFYFDPLSLPTINLFNSFIVLQNRSKLSILWGRVQPFTSDTCGEFCMYFIIHKHAGEDNLSRINHKRNELVVMKYLYKHLLHQ